MHFASRGPLRNSTFSKRLAFQAIVASFAVLLAAALAPRVTNATSSWQTAPTSYVYTAGPGEISRYAISHGRPEPHPDFILPGYGVTVGVGPDATLYGVKIGDGVRYVEAFAPGSRAPRRTLTIAQGHVTAVTADPSGNIYVAYDNQEFDDSANRFRLADAGVAIFDGKGRFLNRIILPSSAGLFTLVYGLALDANGVLYINEFPAQTEIPTIAVVEHPLTQHFVSGSFTSPSLSETGSGLAVQEGRVYVTNYEVNENKVGASSVLLFDARSRGSVQPVARYDLPFGDLPNDGPRLTGSRMFVLETEHSQQSCMSLTGLRGRSPSIGWSSPRDTTPLQ